jgi:hypothetical protein
MDHNGWKLRGAGAVLLLAVAGLLGLGGARAAQQALEPTPAPPAARVELRGPVVSKAVSPADNRRLPAAPLAAVRGKQEVEAFPALPLPPAAQASRAGTADPVRQAHPGIMAMPALEVNFEGQGIDDGGGYAPPDTDGQVGKSHYVQMVNVTTAVYDKSGNLLYGPFLPGDLWPVGDPCHENHGDPVALYDQQADRWLLTQFSVNGPFYQCIAVSKGPTPTNLPADWYVYTFLVSETKMNDYPKLGVWPDGYYMSANQFIGGWDWGGVGVWVFEREKMILGQPATFQYFDLGDTNSNYSGLLPSQWMGATPPPAGAPNYFTSVDQDWNAGTDDILHLWEFHVDWDTPANTTFTLAADLVVAPFEWNLCADERGACIDQPGTTNKLEGLNDRLMMHLAYRNFGDHQALVVNHTVNADGANHAGIRWYEIRSPGAGAVIYQQSTYQPDTSHRWMGSLAMDRAGNLALGYSVSDATSTYPSIRYAGRLAGDPLNQLSQGESSMVVGGGAQTSPERWGDYSAMSVDPVDDCTFWYTQEYIQANGGWNWHTRIAAFRYANCSSEPQGTLEGSVQDAGSGLGIAGALVQAASPTLTLGTNTLPGGGYQLALPTGSYSVTVSAYGYLSQTVSGVPIVSGTTTTQDFSLSLAPVFRVEGAITDAQTGWPLYALVSVDGDPVPAVWSDPLTGGYALELVGGTEYTMRVTAFSPGYPVAQRSLGPLSGDAVEDFSLQADLEACSAPGYSRGVMLFEGFESKSAPAGWTIVNNPSGGAGWRFDNPGMRPNQTGGEKNFAIIDSDVEGSVDVDSELRTPVLDFSSETRVVLDFKYDYYYYDAGNAEKAEVDVSRDGGASWTNVWARSTGSDRGPKDASLDISALAAGQPDVMVRFHYYDANWEWYWQVDEVAIHRGCEAGSGGLVVGQVLDGQTGLPLPGAAVASSQGSGEAAATDDPAAGDAFFTVFAPSGAQPITGSMPLYTQQVSSVAVPAGGAVAQDFSLAAGSAAAEPQALSVTLELGQVTTAALEIQNLGGAALQYKLAELSRPAAALGAVERPADGVVRAWRQEYRSGKDIRISRPVVPAAVLDAGGVTGSWQASANWLPWGAAYDPQAGTLWVSEGWSTNQVFEYTAAGTPTGRVHDFPWQPQSGPADAATNWNTGRLWVMDVSGDNCLHEIDPALGATGKKICPAFSLSQRGLAYDPASDTWFSGSWNDGVVVHFTSQGAVLDQAYVGLNIAGLAYNPDTQHLFVMQNPYSGGQVYVLDTANQYQVVGQFDISQGFGTYSGAGLEFDCGGHLWGVDQVSGMVYQFDSGETTSLCSPGVAWLSAAPASGPLAAHSAQPVEVGLDARLPAVDGPGDYFARLLIVEDTPYGAVSVPVSLTVTASTGKGRLEGTVTGLGSCDQDPAGLAGAQVTAAGGGRVYTTTTQAGGGYVLVLPTAGSPYAVAVSASGHQAGQAEGVAVGVGGARQDFDLRWQQPCLAASPRSLEAALATGNSLKRSLELANTGAGAAIFSLQGPAWAAASPAAGFVPADGSTLVEITFTALPTLTLEQVYTGLLEAVSNDPLHPLQTVTLTLQVVEVRHGVQLSADQEKSALPGSTVLYTVWVTNTGTVTDSYDVGLQGIWPVQAVAAAGPLAPGEAGAVEVRVTVPPWAGENAEDTSVVSLTSQGDGLSNRSVRLTTRSLAARRKLWLPMIRI